MYLNVSLMLVHLTSDYVHTLYCFITSHHFSITAAESHCQTHAHAQTHTHTHTHTDTCIHAS